ncbi:hypothetical protein [Streptomyces sp. Ag109_O5-10]|uniref:hypothetical protein n=1 Tax=Streptomyces sp. Ag109_O5-10 TaxID=1855349 RepID=UPI00089580B8|nr:hypothetical protein [Streptomyces sp. Ag109_O5-10]SEF19006.1 hypothetical protein SAMN05216533_8554 [Streptomyces sp. Ag109_O5-10]
MTYDPTTQPLSPAAAAAEAERLIAEAYRPDTPPPVPAVTSYRDTNPLPAYGSTPPVAQQGRPPMSQRAVDVSTVMLAGSVASVPVGGITCLVLWTLDAVNPVNLAIGGLTPVAILLAAGALLSRLKGVHTEHHHHYSGPVHQDLSTTTTNTAKGVLAVNRSRHDSR